jgi:hypothetical protein
VKIVIKKNHANYGLHQGAIGLFPWPRLLLIGTMIAGVHLILWGSLSDRSFQYRQKTSGAFVEQREMNIVFVQPSIKNRAIGSPRLHGGAQLRRTWKKEANLGGRQRQSKELVPPERKDHETHRNSGSTFSKNDADDKYQEYLRASELSRKSVLKTLLGDKMLLELPPGASGAITVTLYINESGRVDEVQVERESESSIDRATLDIIVGFIKALEFEPGLVGDVPVKTRFKMELFL